MCITFDMAVRAGSQEFSKSCTSSCIQLEITFEKTSFSPLRLIFLAFISICFLSSLFVWDTFSLSLSSSCCVVSRQYSAVHKIEHIRHVSASFSFLDESKLERAPLATLPAVRPPPLLPLPLPLLSFSMF